MSTPLIALVTLMSLGVAVSFVVEGKPGMGLCFLGYSIANVGIIMETYR